MIQADGMKRKKPIRFGHVQFQITRNHRYAFKIFCRLAFDLSRMLQPYLVRCSAGLTEQAQ